MLDTGYLYAKDQNRIFINTCLGCNGACTYCYLPKFYSLVSDEMLIKRSLRGICNVYSRSSQVMQTYRKRFRDFEG